MKLSIRSKLLLGFFFVLSIALATQIIGFFLIRSIITEQVHTSLSNEAHKGAEIVSAFIAELELEHQAFASKYIEANQTITPELSTIMGFQIEKNPFYNKITFLLPSGREFYGIGINGPLSTSDLSFEIPTGYFNTAVRGETGISKVFFLEDDTAPRISIFYPIIGKSGNTVAIIKSELHLSQLWEVIAEITPGNTGFAYIVDDSGRLIAHPDDDLLQSGQSLADRPIVAHLLAQTSESDTNTHTDGHATTPSFIYVNLSGKEVVANGLTVDPINWGVIVQQETTEAFQSIRLLENGFYSTLIITIIFLIVVSFLLSKNLTDPISKLTLMANKVREGDLNSRVLVKTGDELEQLGNSFNEMTASLLASKQILEQDKEHIAAERNKMEVVVAGINDAVIALDTSGQIILFNKTAEDITGYSSREALQQHISDLIQLTEGDVHYTLQDYMPKHKPGFEGIVFTKQGISLIGNNKKTVAVDVISSQISEAESADLGCILTIHDVSREKALEDMKLDFVSLAAHELRTPLTAITGYLSVFIDENESKLNLDQLTMVTRANIASQQLVALVENLLNVSHIERGTVSLQITPVRWADTIRSAVADLQSRAKDKSVSLIYREPTQTLPDVFVDKLRISEVVNNLIANAINYTEKGGSVTVWNEVKDDEVLTFVQDTGIGIPKEALPNLFKKFFRVSGALEHGSKGTGLGLYISKSIIEMHHGKIWVESQLGKGSTFIFSLPTKVYDQGTSDRG